MKYFRMSYEEVVFKRSYINIILLNRSIPSYNFDKEDNDIDDDKPTGAPKNKYRKKQSFKHESQLFESLM